MMSYPVYFAVAKTWVTENATAIEAKDLNFLTGDLTNTIKNVVEYDRMALIQEIQKMTVGCCSRQQMAVNSIIALIRKGGIQ